MANNGGVKAECFNSNLIDCSIQSDSLMLLVKHVMTGGGKVISFSLGKYENLSFFLFFFYLAIVKIKNA